MRVTGEKSLRALCEVLAVKQLQVVLSEVLGLYGLRITRARISPRLRQESFPLAGDAGFRPCRGIFYHNRICRRKGLISSRR